MNKRPSLIAAALASALLGLLGACQNPASPQQSAAGVTIAAPVIAPSGGTFPDASLVVSMSSSTAGAAIFYTQDDSTPTSQSNRYTASFRQFGNFKIKAIAVLGPDSSAVSAASFTLNNGRAANQLGLIKGFVRIPASAPDVKPETINIFSNDQPGVVVHPDATGFFVFDGLDTTHAYAFYFTNQELGPIPGSRKLAPRALTGGVAIATQLQNILPAAGSGVNLNDVTLKKTGRIIGKALMHGRTGDLAADHTGIDIYVPGTSFAGKTDTAGNFTLSYVPEGTYKLRAERAGYTFRDAAGIMVASEVDTNIADQPLLIYYGYGTVTGSVILVDGSTNAPSANGAKVLLKNLVDPALTYNTTTASDGSFVVSSVEPGSYVALVGKEGFLSGQIQGITVEAARVQSAGSIALRALGGSVAGRATLKGAADYAGIIIVAQDAASGKIFTGATASGGAYRLDPVMPGSYRLTASRAGYSTRVIEAVGVVSGTALSSIDFTELAPASGTIAGTVKLEGGAGFAGVAVTARKSDDATVNLTSISDASGSYILSDVKPGIYLIRFARDGFLSGDGVQATLVSDGIVVAPEALLKSSKAKIAGMATLAGRSDYSGVALLATGAAGKTANTVSDSTGHFALVGLDPDTWTVQATMDGFTTARSDPFALGAGASREDIALALGVSTRSIAGKVSLEGTAVYSGTKITATNIADLHSIYSALTNDAGYYVLAGMFPGSYIVSFSRENYKGLTTNAVSVATTSTYTMADQNLEMARGGVMGIARLEGRSSHAGTRVLLTGSTSETTTAADGSYSFQVPSGNYPGGVRFELVDFETTMNTDTITVLTDSTYGVPTSTIKATANTVSGTIDLLGTSDDSGIAVGVDGHAEFATTTAAAGTWSIAHMPLGTYTFRFSRANTPDVTTAVAVIAGDAIALGKLDMTPNASGLKGYVKLTGMTDHSGIKVAVTTAGRSDLSATSNSSGYFEIGNILSTGSHTVTASKPGWDSWTTTIADFQPLELRAIGTSPEITLVDTTAPVVNSVLINAGANFTSSKVVTVAVAATELGSGIDKMQVQLNGYPTSPNWEAYSALFSRDLSTFYNYTGNEVYAITVTLRDRVGHISAPASDSISLTSQLTVVSGPLAAADLHWTKAKSPYSVTGNARVQPGDTLVIDPGVEVRFAGDFYIESYGTISAVGTGTEPIIFSKESSYPGSMGSPFVFMAEASAASATADGTWTAGSRFSNVRFIGASNPFRGAAGKYLLESSTLAFGSTIDGAGVKTARTASGIIVNCEITNMIPTGTVLGCSVHDIYDNFGGSISGTMKNTTLWSVWDPPTFTATIENVLVDTAHSLSFSGTITGLTVRNADRLSLSGTVSSSRFANIGESVDFSSTTTHVSLSEFSGVGTLKSTATWSPATASIDLRGNYFGLAATEEMNLRGVEINKSFTLDYWDDITKAKLDTSGYLSSAPATVGYQGTAYVGPDARSTIASTMVSVQGGSSASIPGGTANGTWSVSGFSIGKYEVTQAQYVAVMGANPSSFKADVNRPVENVSWYDAVEFCNRLSLFAGKTPAYSYTGYGTNPSTWPTGWKTTTHNNVAFNAAANGYRLPTEAEWEWAARGGTASAGYTYAGGNTVEDVGWISTNAGNTTHPVGGKLPNELGLYDMSGNVFEWCWDWSGGSMAGANPKGAATGSYRVLRGGSWNFDEYLARVGYRGYHYLPYLADNYYGVRVVVGSP